MNRTGGNGWAHGIPAGYFGFLWLLPIFTVNGVAVPCDPIPFIIPKNVPQSKNAHRMKSLKSYPLIALLVLTSVFSTRQAYGCYAIVAGKDATADGSVLVAHSELNKPKNCFLNFHVVPGMSHTPGSTIRLQYEGTYPDVSYSHSFLWSENMGMEGSDGVMNEWGVVCVSDGTPSKETDMDRLKERGQIEDGGVGFRLRIEVARRAQTAREGVKIVADMVERFGSRHAIHFVIADANEAWIMALPKGKQWVARRVRDDRVVALPNVNIIQEVHPEDTSRFMVSDHLIDYAIERGWYDPEKDGTFNYKKAYGKPKWTAWFEEKYGKDPRQFRGQWLLTGEEPDLSAEGFLPFSVKPDKKITLHDLRAIMSDHMEGTRFDQTNGYKKGSPHDLMGPRDGAICDQRNQEVAIFQLRSWMPPAVGCVYWRSTAAICSGVITPWYAGITETPESYQVNPDSRKDLITEYHFNPPASIYHYNENKAFWIFNTLENLVDLKYRKEIKKVAPVWKEFEKELYAMQQTIEQKALDLYRNNPELARKFLTHYCKGVALEAQDKAVKMNRSLRNTHFGY